MLKPIVFLSEDITGPDLEDCSCAACNGQGAGGKCECGTKNGGGGDPIKGFLEE